VRISFSGTEPERCVLLRQYVPLEPKCPYRLHWEAESNGIESPSGLAWHLRSSQNDRETDLAAGDLLMSDSPRNWDFTSPPANAILRLLTLEYTRPLGSTRLSGDVILRSVSLEHR
jgi:hypothetical protein